MLVLINAIHTVINDNKDLDLLKRDIDLSFLHDLFVSGLPKLTLSQNLLEKRNQFVKRFSPTHPSTKHVICKERITDILGGDIYHAAKIKSYIKDRLENLSNAEFTSLKTRCDKIRSPQHLLGVFTEIMHEGRMVSLLKESQLESLLSSWKELKKIINKGVQTFKQETVHQNIKLKERISLQEQQLFVIQTLYDLSSENNITLEKCSSMDEANKEKLFSIISEDNINSCLEKNSRFEKTLFTQNPDQNKLKELKSSIHQAVKEDLCCLEHSFVSA